MKNYNKLITFLILFGTFLNLQSQNKYSDRKINNIKNPYEVYKILQNNIADSKENSPSENSNSDSENTDVKMPAELKKITDTVNKGMKFFQIVPKIIFMFVVVWMAYQFYIQFMSH